MLIYKYTLPIMFILSNCGNFISMTIFFRKSWRKNVCVLYLKSYLLVNTFYNISDFNSILCKIYQYTLYLSISLSINTLFMASIDRLLISSQKIDIRMYSSKRLAYFLLSISTPFWIIYYLHFLIKSDVEEVFDDYFSCTFGNSEPYLSFVYYSIAGTNFIACSLMIILCILSFKNVKQIRVFPSHQHQGMRSMTKKDFQLLRCLYALDVIHTVFTLLTTTYDAYALLTESQRQTSWDRSKNRFFAQLFTILNMIPHVSSFWIFVSISKAFRSEIKCSC